MFVFYRHSLRFVAMAVFMLMLLPAQLGHAIAFCALRDPTHQIYDLYPSATSFRSLVSRVDHQVKDDVGAQLPFTLHNRELGQHTLYVVLEDEQPQGLVHVRSESSRWGLVEIVWSMDLDLRVRDFRFQRCRDRACGPLVDGPFRSYLQGKSLDDLEQLLADDELDLSGLPVAPEEQVLASAVLRSALKTLLVTKLVWASELAEVG